MLYDPASGSWTMAGTMNFRRTAHAANRGEKITVIFVNNAIYGMTGGQMAPTTLPGQKTTSSPLGRDTSVAGYPLPVTEMLSLLPGVAYAARGSVAEPGLIGKTKAANRGAVFVPHREHEVFQRIAGMIRKARPSFSQLARSSRSRVRRTLPESSRGLVPTISRTMYTPTPLSPADGGASIGHGPQARPADRPIWRNGTQPPVAADSARTCWLVTVSIAKTPPPMAAVVTGEKIQFIAKVGADALAKGAHAGNLLREVAKVAGGGGVEHPGVLAAEPGVDRRLGTADHADDQGKLAFDLRQRGLTHAPALDDQADRTLFGPLGRVPHVGRQQEDVPLANRDVDDLPVLDRGRELRLHEPEVRDPGGVDARQ